MQSLNLYYTQDWYVMMSDWQKELVRITLELLSREERLKSNFADYSFLVFPIAKAYEGFLKDFFYKLNFISRETYTDRRFRIGKALNPDMSPSHRDEEWLYDQIAQSCGSQLARDMWNTWLECRNQLFHYFPDNEKKINLDEAIKRVEMISNMMNGMTQCRILTHQNSKQAVSS